MYYNIKIKHLNIYIHVLFLNIINLNKFKKIITKFNLEIKL